MEAILQARNQSGQARDKKGRQFSFCVTSPLYSVCFSFDNTNIERKYPLPKPTKALFQDDKHGNKKLKPLLVKGFIRSSS